MIIFVNYKSFEHFNEQLYQIMLGNLKLNAINTAKLKYFKKKNIVFIHFDVIKFIIKSFKIISHCLFFLLKIYKYLITIYKYLNDIL